MHVVETRRINERPGRSGALLIELVVSMIVLGAVSTVIIPALMRAEDVRQASVRRGRAMQQLANVFEHVAAVSYEELTEDAVRAAAERAGAGGELPRAELHLAIAQETDPVPARRVALTLTWRSNDSPRVQSVRLTEWFYKQGDRP
jgi:hypothetical protein